MWTPKTVRKLAVDTIWNRQPSHTNCVYTGADLVGHYEGAGFGMTWGSIFEDEFSMAWILILLLADTFLYAAVAWYASLVNPTLTYALVLTILNFRLYLFVNKKNCCMDCSVSTISCASHKVIMWLGTWSKSCHQSMAPRNHLCFCWHRLSGEGK